MPTQNREDTGKEIFLVLLLTIPLILLGVVFASYKSRLLLFRARFAVVDSSTTPAKKTMDAHSPMWDIRFYMHGHVAEKAVSCITHCHQGCCEDGGDPSCFSSCCNCLDGAYDALAPLVQPPL